jgi:Zn finger protein HypA/HybF involved in hydrogenase expression
MSPYGLTSKQIKELSAGLGELLEIETEKIENVMDQLTRREVLRIAKNEIQEKE